MAQPNVYEAQEVIQKSIGYITSEKKKDLINLLRQNGVQVNDSVSDKDLMRMTYLGIAKSLQFKKDFAKYLESLSQDNQVGYVSEEFFNLTAAEKAAKKTEKAAKIKEQGGTKAGNLIRTVATEQNIQSVINTGLGILSQKLTAKADQKSIAAATDLAVAESQKAKLEADAASAKAKSSNAWVLPVVIGAIVIIGVGFYFYKKRNK